ncbi:Ig-like domain-containing protein [Blautia faecicola]|uniref:Ig-like domain-containing protein n=1 Tax=Blautia faecicola TaxID=2509240 RepID=UPI003FD7A94F
MKTKKIKRVLAFFLAVVFAFSTCMTASPYTVQATEEPKLSVNVTNAATTETGPGLTKGIDLVINYGENQKKLRIGNDQLGNELSTDILYEEFSDASYSVSLSDRNNLYNVTAETSVDAETKSLNITITELKVKTEGNEVFPGMSLVYVNAVNSFYVDGPWKDYINGWEIREKENKCGAEITGPSDAQECKVTTSKGSKGSDENEKALFTIVAKVDDTEIASQTIESGRNETTLSIKSDEEKEWTVGEERTFTFELKSGSTPLANREIEWKYGADDEVGTMGTYKTDENGEVSIDNIRLSRKPEKFSIEGIFKGDDAYSPAEVKGEYSLTKASGKLWLDENSTEYTAENPLVLTYGTEDTEFPVVLKNSDGNEINEELAKLNAQLVSPQDNITVVADAKSGKITITPKNASGEKTEVKITGETQSYTFERTIYVKVDPYPLKINKESVKAYAPGKKDNAGYKIYDGTKLVDVQATLEDAGEDTVKGTDKNLQDIETYFKNVTFKSYEGNLSDVKLNSNGEEKQQKLEFKIEKLDSVEFENVTENGADTGNIIKALKTNYKIEEVEMEVPLTIQKRTLKLGVRGVSRGFRDLKYVYENEEETETEGKDLKDLNLVFATGFVNGQDEDKLKGFKFPKVVDTTATDLTEENVKEKDTAECGKHTGALVLQEEDQITNPTNNYKFDLTATGTLEITEEKDAAGYLSVDNINSSHAYEAGGKRYYGKNATVQFSETGGYNRVYWVNGDKNEDITTAGLGLGNEQKNISRSFYLTKEENSGKIIAKTEAFPIDFEYDAEAPVCVTTLDTSDNIVRTLGTAITFGIYKNHTIEANIKLEDEKSGVNGMSYFIARTDVKKEKYEELLTEADYTEALTEEQFTTEDLVKNSNDTWTIKNIGKLKAEETLECNNYIIFVKAKDNVGNVKIYGSNGIVLEDNRNDISVTYTESAAKDVKCGEWNGINYYSGDVNLNVTAKEEASDVKFYSGLAQMEYQVSYVYGDGTTGKDKKVIEKASPQNVTLEELDAYRTITTAPEGVPLTTDSKKSKVITITAPASETKDNAGNTMENDAVHTLVIDSISPTVKAEYTQKNLNEKNEPHLRNKKYANSDVTYTVTVTERFLKNITVSINGKDYTLDELEKNKESLGIKEITKDELPDITKTTDQTEYVFSIVFDKDGKYKVKTIATDAAGNTGDDVKDTENEDGFEFIIDTVAPTLDLTYTAKQNNTETQLALDPKYDWFGANNATAGDNGTIGITAALTEENFSAEFADIAVEATDSTGAAVDITDYKNAVTKAVKTQERWTESNTDEGRKYTLALPEIAVDANYKITYTCTDLAGNSLKPITHHVTLDRKNPEGEVKAEDLENNGSPAQIWNSLIETITFEYFGKNNVRVSMASQDATSGVESTQYLKSADGLTREELENRTDWTPYVSGLSYAANQHLVVYEKVTDKVGNTEYFSTDGIIVDNTSPVPVVMITPTSPGWGKGVYSAGDHPGFSIRVEDPIVNDAYAGLKKITYRIENGTTGYVESNTLADENTGLSKAAHQKVWTGQVSIDPNLFYSNDVKVSVYAEDWSANSVTSQPQTLKVDNKAPIVSFSFDKSDVHNGKYYKNDKTLTITVDERNFDESYLPRVTSTTGGGYSISGWSHNGELHTATVTFSGDSDYTVSYDCYDLAGNKSNTENLEEFTVDKTVPVIKVSYNNNSAQNGNYYKAARTATITVTEHNFDPSKITVSTTASAGGAPSIGGWANSGDTHTANVVFNHDADYTFTVSGLDLADNKAADYAQDKFTVDLKNPEVKITGVKDKSANNGTVAPRISISDTNFIASGVKITLKGVNKGEIKIDSLASISSSAIGMNVIFKDFPEGMDDIYTLTAKATDKAGNETKSSITFSVNRDGSTYELGSGTKALVDKKYTNKPQDLEITEINVDDLTTIEITYSLDGKIVTLKEGEDYTITKSGEEGQWKKYLYRIKASCFEEEGNYVINIYSEDAAHNSTTNKTKAKTIAFTVDKTAPTMVVSNLTDRGRYKENVHEFTLNVKDNIFLAYVEVYLDGELFKRFEEDEIAQLNGELPVDIASSNQYQTIELVSCDKADNISKEVYDPETNAQVPASYRVLVTQNSFVQFINNTPLLVSVIVIIVAIAGLIVVLMKRKKDKEK